MMMKSNLAMGESNLDSGDRSCWPRSFGTVISLASRTRSEIRYAVPQNVSCNYALLCLLL